MIIGWDSKSDTFFISQMRQDETMYLWASIGALLDTGLLDDNPITIKVTSQMSGVSEDEVRQNALGSKEVCGEIHHALGKACVMRGKL